MPAVLDASALLALILQEPGEDVVRAAVRSGSSVCSVNLAEVATALLRRGFPFDEVAARVASLPVSTVDFDIALALEAAALFPATRRVGLSLGDRACLALARRDGLPALTSDRAWLTVAEKVGVAVQMIR